MVAFAAGVAEALNSSTAAVTALARFVPLAAATSLADSSCCAAIWNGQSHGLTSLSMSLIREDVFTARPASAAVS